MVIDGEVLVDLWAPIANFPNEEKIGIVTAYLGDFDGVGYNEIGNGTVYASDWQEVSPTFVSRPIIMVVTGHTVPAGNQIEVRLIVEAGSDEMWFAHDGDFHQGCRTPALATGALEAV